MGRAQRALRGASGGRATRLILGLLPPAPCRERDAPRRDRIARETLGPRPSSRGGRNQGSGCAALGVGTLGAGTRAAHVSTRALPRGRLPCASGASGAYSGQPAGTRTLHVLSTAVALLDLTTCQHGSRAVLRQLRQLLGRRLLSPSERVDGGLERLQLTRVALPAGRRSCGRLLLPQLL